eukprot:scaffold146689_cov22-Tisochrysis_lutea.AAC.1
MGKVWQIEECKSKIGIMRNAVYSRSSDANERGAAECGLAGTQIESLSGCGAECELQACGLNLPGSDLDVVLLNVLDDVETPMVSTDS